MKKFFLFAAAVATALTINAADKVWNFTSMFTSENAPAFTVGDGATPDALVADELYVYGNAKDKAWAMDFGQSPKYFVDFLTVDDQDADSKLARLKSGGAGSIKEGKIKGAIAFRVGGDSFIQIAAVSSSGSDTRKMQILNAAGEELASFKFDGNVGKKVDGEIVDAPFSFEYEGPEADLFIVSAEGVDGDTSYKAGGINYYKIAATNVVAWQAPQGVENVQDAKNTTIKRFENGQLVIIKNGVKYNALGTAL